MNEKEFYYLANTEYLKTLISNYAGYGHQLKLSYPDTQFEANLDEYSKKFNSDEPDKKTVRGTMKSDMSEYEGEFLEFSFHGYGRLREKYPPQIPYPDDMRTVYEGEFENGCFHGKGTIFFLDGTKYTSEWYKGCFLSEGIFELSSGQTFSGHWLDNKRNVGRTFTSLDGEDGGEYSSNLVSNNLNGYGSLEFPDGGRYEGQWKNGLYHGEGVLVFSDGDKYEGNFRNNNFHGKGEFTSDNIMNGFERRCTFFARGLNFSNNRKESEIEESSSINSQELMEFLSDYIYEDTIETKIFGNHNTFAYESVQWINSSPQSSFDYNQNYGYYSGEWKNDLHDGYGDYIEPPPYGHRYTGEWKNGLYHGEGVLVSSLETFKGNWKEGEKHGFGETIPKPEFQTGPNASSRSVGTWKDGERIGEHSTSQDYGGDI